MSGAHYELTHSITGHDLFTWVSRIIYSVCVEDLGENEVSSLVQVCAFIVEQWHLTGSVVTFSRYSEHLVRTEFEFCKGAAIVNVFDC